MRRELFQISLFICYCVTNCWGKYVIPEVLVEPFAAGGVRISIPVTAGEDIQLFAFHANINRPIRGKEEGDISRSATKPVAGRWTVTVDGVQLKPTDKLHYWVFAQNNRLGFDREDQLYVVQDLVDRSKEHKCPESVSRFNNDEPLCANAVIFEDTFNRNEIDANIWEVLQYSPQYALAGREFVSYERNKENLFIKNKVLHFKPTIVNEDNLYEDLDLTQGCSIDDNPKACFISNFQSAHEVSPPIKSARIRSKTAFKYGRIEVDAKIPLGDWIVPHIVLEPRDHKYGDEFRSGELYVSYNRGNRNLQDGTKDVGQRSLYCGPAFSEDRTRHMHRLQELHVWGNDFHTYSLEWSPDGLVCMIDNKKIWDYKNPNAGFASLAKDLEYAKRWTSRNAPFDEYFHVTLGLSVGGVIDFPAGVKKPWDNTEPRAPIHFYEDRKNWDVTWSEDSMLRVRQVRVYAI